jgi:hypothetical protein
MRFGCLRPCSRHATRLKLEARCFAAVVSLTRQASEPLEKLTHTHQPIKSKGSVSSRDNATKKSNNLTL